MDTTSYTTARAAAKQELADANAELGEAQQKVQDLGNRIADRRQTVTVISLRIGGHTKWTLCPSPAFLGSPSTTMVCAATKSRSLLAIRIGREQLLMFAKTNE
jgi:hypothetical protein